MEGMGEKPRRRRAFTAEFKAEIVELCQPGYMREWRNARCTNAAQLHQELRDRGYAGGASYVR